MPEERFIAITPPPRGEGVGRALQAAFGEGCELPEDLQFYVIQLDQIEL